MGAPGVRRLTGDTPNETKLTAVHVAVVDRNRRMRNRMYGGVRGPRG